MQNQTEPNDQKKQDIRAVLDIIHRNIDDPIELAAALSALIEIVEDKPSELVPFPLEPGWVAATPLDAIQDPPLRCRVKPYGKPNEWVESLLIGYDRSDEFHWGVADEDIQWATTCEVWK